MLTDMLHFLRKNNIYYLFEHAVRYGIYYTFGT